ncbi:MAG: hypothetical protein SGBAC_011407 [Bacillariaceae sp.]
MSRGLESILAEIPPCPRLNSFEGNIDMLQAARHDLQHWLNTVLMNAEARESQAVRNFLTYAANMIPPEYESLPWAVFDANGQITSSPNQGYAQNQPSSQGNGNLDDMSMVDMFDAGDEVGPVHNYDSDDEDEYRPSERYKPTDEPVTEEDEMDIAMMADEARIIEGMGTYSQSLGASHMSRFPMLEGESADSSQEHYGMVQQSQPGVQLGGAVGGSGVGGIGSAMKEATLGIGGGFSQAKLESPPRLDSFKMIKVIGKGSFGKVFLVRENKTGEMFALKVLRKDNIIKRNQVEHTITERSVLEYIKHRFIVGMRMAFQSKDKLYFVLDYCAGGELFFQLGKIGKFPEPRARFYAAEIILALSYVHTLDIIYRDLKPENVLLDDKGHIRLTDFGLSKEGISSSSSGANSFCGTPEYLAPEILNRQGHGRAVDWWSLGALLYEMLTGLPPFYCQDRERLFAEIRKGELQYPASLSPNAKSLLRGLLTKDPTKRLGSGPADALDIQQHPFFASVDWQKLQDGEIKAPWAPQINGSSDTSQFDKEFTSMPIFSPQSMQRHPGFGTTPMGDNPFEGFTFQDKIFHGPGTHSGN